MDTGAIERGELGSTGCRVAIGSVQLRRSRQAIVAGAVIAVVLVVGTWLWRRRPRP